MESAFRVFGDTIANDVSVEEGGASVYVSVRRADGSMGYGWTMRPGDALTMAEVLTRIALKVKNDAAMRAS